MELEMGTVVLTLLILSFMIVISIDTKQKRRKFLAGSK